MKILLKTVSAAGAPPTDRWIDTEALHIGRGTDQDVVLADLRVALHHAEITVRKTLLGVSYRVEGKTRLGVWVNGNPVPGANLSVGDVLDFGRHRLTVLKSAPGSHVTLRLEESYATHDERETRRKGLKLSLADAGWSRRPWAWLLFVGVLVPGLVLPVLWHQAPADKTVTREHAPQPDAGIHVLWNSGPLSSAHQALNADCAACHRLPFVPAGDASCKGCHGALPEHAASTAALAKPPFGEQQCTDCHREHNGVTGLIPADNRTCTDCHADPARMGDAKLAAVHDWSKSHPPFRVQLARKHGDEFRWIEAAQDRPEATREDTGLKFPHDLHLSPKGIDAPGGRRRMECADCHTPAADGIGFAATRMETQCAECHRLDFDPDDAQRTLPHGQPAEVVRVIRDHYARLALAGGVTTTGAPAVVQARRRPGAVLPPASAQAALAWADGRADVALRDVFERRTCFYCHTVTKDGPAAAPWRIAPVAAEKPAFASTPFPHSAHATERCETCHTAESSKKSEDVLLPDIAHCRDCHGDTGAMTETPAPCQSCHGYHLHNLHAAAKKPAAHPDTAPSTAPSASKGGAR